MDQPTQDTISLQDDSTQPARNGWNTLQKALVMGTAAVAVLVLAGLMVVLMSYGSYGHDQHQPITFVRLVLATIVLGLTAVVVCVGVVWLVYLQRQTLQQTRSLDQYMAAMAEQSFHRATAVSPQGGDSDLQLLEIRRLLADMREILLLPEPQRQARFRTLMQFELQRRLAATEQFIIAREFHRARAELASLRDRFGDLDEIRRKQEQLSNAMFSALGEDIDIALRKVSDLITIGRWQQAEQYAHELIEKYPDATEPRKLLERVHEERLVFERRHRQRMHDEIQQFVNQRRWREAAHAADLFIQTFPTGVDTDVLQQQLETLHANAEIEIRQQLERHIKEHITRKDYWAALALARRIIAEYPSSPQANVLRTQLPRLEELARQQGPHS